MATQPSARTAAVDEMMPQFQKTFGGSGSPPLFAIKMSEQTDALVRIEDGSYGYCEETGDPIGVLRLLARPTATLTIEAQERREMKQKMYGE